MNIRPKQVRNSKERHGDQTYYHMRRVIDDQFIGYDLVFSDSQMAERGFVAHRILHARLALRDAVERLA